MNSMGGFLSSGITPSGGEDSSVDAARPRGSMGNNFSTPQDVFPPLTTGDDSESGAENVECAICRGSVQGRAVIDPCFHFYCYACIKRWIETKIECPLCKRPINKLMYDIVSETDYKEEAFSNQLNSQQPSYENFTNVNTMLSFLAADMLNSAASVAVSSITNNYSGVFTTSSRRDQRGSSLGTSWNGSSVTYESVSHEANISVTGVRSGAIVTVRNVTSNCTVNIRDIGAGSVVTIDGLHNSVVTITGSGAGAAVTVKSINSSCVSLEALKSGSCTVINNVSNDSQIIASNVGLGAAVTIQGVPSSTRRTYPVQNSYISVRNVGTGARFIATNIREERIEINNVPMGQSVSR